MYRIKTEKLDKILDIKSTQKYIVDNFDESTAKKVHNIFGTKVWNKGLKCPELGFKKGSTPWNKGKKGLQKSTRKGVPRSEETRRRISEATKIGMKKYYENRTSN